MTRLILILSLAVLSCSMSTLPVATVNTEPHVYSIRHTRDIVHNVWTIHVVGLKEGTR